MKKASFNHRKLMALCAVMALTLVQNAIGFSPVRSAVPTLAVDDDLANELRTVENYAADLVTYQKECSQLNKRPSLLNTDIDPVQRKSDDLKRRLSDVQSAVREVTRKLKAANQWNDLDNTLVASITDAGLKKEFQQESFKQLLEDAGSSLTSHANEISLPIENLRKKIAGRTSSPNGDAAFMVLAAYNPPAVSVYFHSLSCTIQTIRVGLIHKLGGRTQGSKAQGDMSCACGNATNITTGEECK